jgi:hypothetical protein
MTTVRVSKACAGENLPPGGFLQMTKPEKLVNGVMYVGGNGFGVAVPQDWDQLPDRGHEEEYAVPDREQQLAINNELFAPNADQAAWERDSVAFFENRFSTKPESTEPTTLAGSYATMRTYHFTYQGTDWFALLIICASDGAGTFYQWLSFAGNEQADRQLFDAIRATFIRTHAWG